MLALNFKKLWPISLIFSTLGFLGCADQGESVKVLNSSGRNCEDVEIAFLKSDQLIDPSANKVSDLKDAEFRFRFGRISNSNEKRFFPIFNVPERVLLEWSEDGIDHNCLVDVPKNIRDYFEENRNRRDGLKKYLTFEINPDRSVSVYLYMWARPGDERVFFPPRDRP